MPILWDRSEKNVVGRGGGEGEGGGETDEKLFKSILFFQHPPCTVKLFSRTPIQTTPDVPIQSPSQIPMLVHGNSNYLRMWGSLI